MGGDWWGKSHLQVEAELRQKQAGQESSMDYKGITNASAYTEGNDCKQSWRIREDFLLGGSEGRVKDVASYPTEPGEITGRSALERRGQTCTDDLSLWRGGYGG